MATAAAEKLACLLIFVSITILVDSQVVRPYVSIFYSHTVHKSSGDFTMMVCAPVRR